MMIYLKKNTKVLDYRELHFKIFLSIFNFKKRDKVWSKREYVGTLCLIKVLSKIKQGCPKIAQLKWNKKVHYSKGIWLTQLKIIWGILKTSDRIEWRASSIVKIFHLFKEEENGRKIRILENP